MKKPEALGFALSTATVPCGSPAARAQEPGKSIVLFENAGIFVGVDEETIDGSVLVEGVAISKLAAPSIAPRDAAVVDADLTRSRAAASSCRGPHCEVIRVAEARIPREGLYNQMPS